MTCWQPGLADGRRPPRAFRIGLQRRDVRIRVEALADLVKAERFTLLQHLDEPLDAVFQRLQTDGERVQILGTRRLQLSGGDAPVRVELVQGLHRIELQARQLSLHVAADGGLAHVDTGPDCVIDVFELSATDGTDQ